MLLVDLFIKNTSFTINWLANVDKNNEFASKTAKKISKS